MSKIRQGIKEYLCLFLMLMSTIVGLSFLPMVGAQAVTTAISTMIPQSGTVGSAVVLVANITTSNGPFHVTFDGAVEATGNAVGNLANATFFVPQTQLGNHTVAIVDLTTNDSASTSFTVSTAYSINVTSVPLKESDSVPIYVNMTGGNNTQGNTVTLSIQAPTNVTYSGNMNITASTTGTGIGSLIYPDNFTTPAGVNANTNFVGSYSISSNTTATPQSFTVDLTNSTEYHRFQTINIKAAGYNNGENVTLTVSGSSFQTVVNLTADSHGIINYSNLTVPANASVGSYNVNIISLFGPTIKAPPDSQTFTVPGFAINITAENRAGESVPNAGITAVENGVSVSNKTTDSNGLAVLTLEIGNYTLQGFDENQEVGQMVMFAVNGNETADFVLNLTDLNIKVVAFVNGAEIGIPEASIYLTPENVSLTTNITGDAVANSLLPEPGSPYGLNVSRYGVPFNFTYAPIQNLLVAGSQVAFFNVTIVSPSFTLLVTVFKADGQPLNNASVEANELVGGITYNATTGPDGIADFKNVTFGTYNVEIIGGTGNVINTTMVELFQDENVTIACTLYDLTISVTVTDYFGQPFANANVTLQGKDFSSLSLQTQADGEATFNNLVGDSFTISVYLSNQGSPTVAQSRIVQGSTAISIRIGRYVLLAGLPVETSQFAATIIMIVSLLAVLLFEVFRRRGKSRKSDS